MNADLNKWVLDVRSLIDPPGCETIFAPSPSGMNRCCTVGVVQEHRFAFYYWAGFAQGNQNRPPPILLTLDSHNDVGAHADVTPSDLRRLDLRDKTRLGLFAWLRLPALNDGQILPALYLNFFSDVYVLLNRKAWCAAILTERTTHQRDRFGDLHAVHYYTDEMELLEALPMDRDVFLDVDLDYFSDPNTANGRRRGTEIQWPKARIRRFLSKPKGLIQTVLPSVAGLTIALEPKCCGGLLNSHRALGIINTVLFDDTLCTPETKWRQVNQAAHRTRPRGGAHH